MSILPDTDAAIRFLERWAALGGTWNISAIPPSKKGMETKSFRPDQKEEARAWISERNGKFNLYFGVNPTLTLMDKKAERTDIAKLIAFHVDADPRVGETPEQCKERTLKAFAEHNPPPSVIIDSGGGLQGFWLLKDHVAIDGDLERAEDGKRWNQELERTFGGDNCHNVDRIMRLPGTVNLPDERKQRKGRVPALATLEHFDAEALHDLTQFKKANLPGGAPSSGKEVGSGSPTNTARGVVSPSTPRVVTRINDVNEDLPASVPGYIKIAIIHGYDVDDPTRWVKNGAIDRSDVLYAVVCALARAGCSDDTIYSVITDKDFKISESVITRTDRERYARRQIERAREALGKGPAESPVLSADDWHANARAFRDLHRPNVLHYRGESMDYDGGRYTALTDDTVKSDVRKFLDGARKTIMSGRGKDAKPVVVPFKPDKNSTAQTIEALEAEVHLGPMCEAPCWLGKPGPNPQDLVSFPNGILNVATDDFLPPTPEYFTPFAAGFDYEPSAAQPTNFLAFLNGVFEGEQDQIESLQEVFGYCLTSDVSQEKCFLFVGAKRSGKGTLMAILRALVAEGCTCGPSLTSLSTNFGLSQLIGKQLAIVDDLRLGAKTDRDLLAENVLKITGRGHFTIDRKHREHWTGYLPVKLVLVSNEMPRLTDDSGAVASRFHTFNTRASFYGREDPTLFRDKLLPERAGVLLWALEGLRRVRERGRLAEPRASVESRNDLAMLGSPVLTFVEQCCVLEPAASVAKDELFRAWANWAGAQGTPPGIRERFAQSLYAATDHRVMSTKLRADGKRVPSFVGVRLTPRGEEPGQRGIPF